MFAVACVLKRLAFDWKSIAIVLAGLALCYVYLYHSTAYDFSLDVDSHKAYIRYIYEHHALPYHHEKGIKAAHHLPTYYLAATALYSLAQSVADPFQMVRHLSVACTAGYLLLASLLLRKTLAGIPYYLALCMVVFWPIGIAISARLHVDSFAYIGQIGVIYALLGYVTEKKTTQLANGFLCAGVLLLARNLGIFFLAVVCMFLLYALYTNRHAWRSILSPRMVVSVLFALACYKLSALHAGMVPDTDFSGVRGAYSLKELAATFFYFNPWQFLTSTVLTPNEGPCLQYFWHFYLRSAILGEYTTWTAWSLVFALGAVWLAVLIYTLIGFVFGWRHATTQERRQLYLLGLFLAMMTGMVMALRFVHMHILGIGDVRYIFPITAIYTIIFAKTISWHMRAGRETVARVGNGLAIGFIMLSIGLWVTQIGAF